MTGKQVLKLKTFLSHNNKKIHFSKGESVNWSPTHQKRRTRQLTFVCNVPQKPQHKKEAAFMSVQMPFHGA